MVFARNALRSLRLEQVRLARFCRIGGFWRLQPQMPPGLGPQHPPARRAQDQPLLQKVRLDPAMVSTPTGPPP